MIRINCPFCGERDHSEFAYGGDATIEYPALDASPEEWHDAVFLRENVRGVQFETWQHIHGCRMWIVVERDTLTHEIHSVRPAHAGWAEVLAAPPQAGAKKKPRAKARAGADPDAETETGAEEQE